MDHTGFSPAFDDDDEFQLSSSFPPFFNSYRTIGVNLYASNECIDAVYAKLRAYQDYCRQRAPDAMEVAYQNRIFKHVREAHKLLTGPGRADYNDQLDDETKASLMSVSKNHVPSWWYNMMCKGSAFAMDMLEELRVLQERDAAEAKAKRDEADKQALLARRLLTENEALSSSASGIDTPLSEQSSLVMEVGDPGPSTRNQAINTSQAARASPSASREPIIENEEQNFKYFGVTYEPKMKKSDEGHNSTGANENLVLTEEDLDYLSSDADGEPIVQEEVGEVNLTEHTLPENTIPQHDDDTQIPMPTQRRRRTIIYPQMPPYVAPSAAGNSAHNLDTSQPPRPGLRNTPDHTDAIITSDDDVVVAYPGDPHRIDNETTFIHWGVGGVPRARDAQRARNNPEWSTEEIVRLVHLYETGHYTFTDIARHLNASFGTNRTPIQCVDKHTEVCRDYNAITSNR